MWGKQFTSVSSQSAAAELELGPGPLRPLSSRLSTALSCPEKNLTSLPNLLQQECHPWFDQKPTPLLFKCIHPCGITQEGTISYLPNHKLSTALCSINYLSSAPSGDCVWLEREFGNKENCHLLSSQTLGLLFSIQNLTLTLL